MAQDSSRPDFWDMRFRGGVTPWDAGGVPPRLAAWLAAEPERLRVLIPGCGIGLAGLRELLESGFSMEQDEPVAPEHSLPVFAGKERWQVWRRKL